MASEQALVALESLGFNHLEAEVYTALLRSGAQSGYRLGQLLNRPDANVYKALTSLRERGAIVEGTGAKRVFKAAPFDQLASALESGLKRRVELAKATLRKVQPSAETDWAMYPLRTFTSVISKVVELVSTAKAVVLADVAAPLLCDIREDLEDAGERGVQVMVKTYTPTDAFKNVVVASSSSSAQVAAQWNADWMNLVVDAKATLLCLIRRDSRRTILQGLWTEYAFLGATLHCALWNEISMTRLDQIAGSDPNRPIGPTLKSIGGFPLAESLRELHDTD